MRPQPTTETLICFRLGDPQGEFPIFSAEGSKLFPGRWNTKKGPLIYTSEHYSTALLENLVRTREIRPVDQHYIRITIPRGTSYETFRPEAHPGWDDKETAICKSIGEEWCRARRSALLIVPSIPARIERNILINPAHPDAAAVRHELPQPVWWDDRLYG